MPKRAANDDYEADGGFVEDAPKSKKSKAAAAGDSKGKDSDAEYWEVSQRERCGFPHFCTGG